MATETKTSKQNSAILALTSLDDNITKHNVVAAKASSSIFSSISVGPPYKAGWPTFPEGREGLLQKRQWQLEHMAAAFRVFARKGFEDGTAGHISVRDPIETNTFWINPFGVHFAMLKASDMVRMSEDGEVVGGNIAAVNAAGFLIHSSIHKARPDIIAACHTHSRYGKAWSTFGLPLDILNQDSTVFWNSLQVVYDAFGGVVLEANEGERIASALGEKGRAAILQNHGLLTVGSTVDEAAHLFSIMERACEVQLAVEAAGLPKKHISDKDAEFTHRIVADPEVIYTEFQPEYNYEVWRSGGELLR